MPSDEMKQVMKDFLKGYRPLMSEVNGINRPIAHSKDREARWIIRNEKQRLNKINGIAKDCEIMDAILGECDVIKVLDAVESNIYDITSTNFVKYRRPFYTDNSGRQYVVDREKWNREPAVKENTQTESMFKPVALF